jgi:hypothetical protein
MLKRITLAKALALLQQGHSLDAYAIELPNHPLQAKEADDLRAAGMEVPDDAVYLDYEEIQTEKTEEE